MLEGKRVFWGGGGRGSIDQKVLRRSKKNKGGKEEKIDIGKMKWQTNNISGRNKGHPESKYEKKKKAQGRGQT